VIPGLAPGLISARRPFNAAVSLLWHNKSTANNTTYNFTGGSLPFGGGANSLLLIVANLRTSNTPARTVSSVTYGTLTWEMVAQSREARGSDGVGVEIWRSISIISPGSANLAVEFSGSANACGVIMLGVKIPGEAPQDGQGYTIQSTVVGQSQVPLAVPTLKEGGFTVGASVTRIAGGPVKFAQARSRSASILGLTDSIGDNYFVAAGLAIDTDDASAAAAQFFAAADAAVNGAAAVAAAL
jgi:hypothetical protein